MRNFLQEKLLSRMGDRRRLLRLGERGDLTRTVDAIYAAMAWL